MTARTFTFTVEPGAPSNATNYLSWDVETGTIDGTFPIYENIGAVQISTAKAHSGTKSIYYNPYTVGDQTDSPVFPLPNLRTLYATWWWWIPKELAGGLGGQHFFRFGSSASGDPNYWYRGQLDPTIAAPGAIGFGVDLFDGVGGDSGSLYHGLTDLPTDRWFKFGILATLNSSVGVADGVLKMWIDDVEVVTKSDVMYAMASGTSLLAYKWTHFALVTNFDNVADPYVGYWYMDDIELWDGVP